MGWITDILLVRSSELPGAVTDLNLDSSMLRYMELARCRSRTNDITPNHKYQYHFIRIKNAHLTLRTLFSVMTSLNSVELSREAVFKVFEFPAGILGYTLSTNIICTILVVGCPLYLREIGQFIGDAIRWYHYDGGRDLLCWNKRRELQN